MSLCLAAQQLCAKMHQKALPSQGTPLSWHFSGLLDWWYLGEERHKMNILGQSLKVQCFNWRQELYFPFLGRYRGASCLANETHGIKCLNGLGKRWKDPAYPAQEKHRSGDPHVFLISRRFYSSYLDGWRHQARVSSTTTKVLHCPNTRHSWTHWSCHQKKVERFSVVCLNKIAVLFISALHIGTSVYMAGVKF